MINVVLGPARYVKESLEHRESHREVGDERRTLRSISSHMSYVIEDEDLLVKDNSDLDEDWDLNQRQSVERILQEEDEDDEEFFFFTTANKVITK